MLEYYDSKKKIDDKLPILLGFFFPALRELKSFVFSKDSFYIDLFILSLINAYAW